MINEKTLILGLGNDILTDDGIGPRLVHSLAQKIDNPVIHFDTACCGGLMIMECIQDFEKAVFIDAIHTRDGKPGDVYYFIPSDFRETLHLSCLHDIYFLTALRLGNALNLNLPADIHIIAVEIIEDMEFGDELTPQMKEKYPEILEKVVVLIKQITGWNKI